MNCTISTPLYYANDKPHLGSTYTTIACDALARFHRLEGDNVLFLTGVDEHGQKIERTAKLNGLEPQEHCDLISNMYLDLWTKYGISFDRYIRTTSNSHRDLVHNFFAKVKQSGDIRIGRQQGWYCVGCEEFKDIDVKSKTKTCDIHLKPLEWRDEENIFFCLSKYQKQIEELVNKEDFIFPISRKNEIVNFVEQGLKDFSISRVNVNWGIDVPNYPGHKFYVWFDALLGYLSGTLDGKKDLEIANSSNEFWQSTTHVIGKDILRFHAVYWPAMLMSAGISLPKKVFGHGFLTREGQKMGKSLGNVLDPYKLLEIYGSDAIRWYLLRDIEFGKDGDYQANRFIDTVNNDLSNTIGNLLNRTLTMSRKWYEGKVPTLTRDNYCSDLEEHSKETIINYKYSFKELSFKKSSECLLDLASRANLYLNVNEPWKSIKNPEKHSEVAFTIYNVLETCRIIGYLLKPITPNLSDKILSQLGIEYDYLLWDKYLIWGKLTQGQILPDPIPVMDRLEIKL